MFKKILSIIIGLTIILPLSFQLINPVSAADIITICDINALNKYFSLEDGKQGEGYKNLEKALKESDVKSSYLQIRIAFEKAREKYHNTFKCVFDVASISILGAPAGIGKNIQKGNLPNLDSALKDLLDTKKVCALWPNELQKIIKGDDPKKSITETLVGPLLEANNNYSEFLKYLIEKLGSNPPVDNTSLSAFGDWGDKFNKLSMIFENEAQDALVALDAAFIGLKELRISFVMHVHFECMLQNLELYRRMMQNLRSIVSALPSVIEDASMHK